MTTDLLISDMLRGREDTAGTRLFFWFCWEFKKQRRGHILEFGMVVEIVNTAESSDMVQATGNDPVQIWLRLKRSETSGRFSFHHPQEFLGYAGLHLPHGIELLVGEDDPKEVHALAPQRIGCILPKPAYHAVVVSQSG